MAVNENSDDSLPPQLALLLIIPVLDNLLRRNIIIGIDLIDDLLFLQGRHDAIPLVLELELFPHHHDNRNTRQRLSSSSVTQDSTLSQSATDRMQGISKASNREKKKRTKRKYISFSAQQHNA